MADETRDLVEELLIAAADDATVLQTVKARLGREALPEARELLAVLRGRARLSIDERREHAALCHQIVTYRAVRLGDLRTAVAAQKALAELEGLEIDASTAVGAAKKLSDAELDARIQELSGQLPDPKALQ